MQKSIFITLLGFFFLALILRFLYFPNDVYFAYDQARDSFASLEILEGNLKLLGPPTTAGDNIFHGAFVYYILAIIYFFSGPNPEIAAAIFRIVNGLGLVLVFFIASSVFKKSVGLLSAFLFAISYEQSQYSLFFGHPALGVFSILIFYLGLALLIFKNNALGFILALFGLGLTIQFEDANIPLVLVFLSFILVFYKKLKILNLKTIFLGVLAFLIAISSFILSEIKYNFRMTAALVNLITHYSQNSTSQNNILPIITRLINDNFLESHLLPIFLIISFICFLAFFKEVKIKIVFLTMWFLGGIASHLLTSSFSYYYSPGASVSLLILVSYFIYKIYQRQKILAVIFLMLIIFNNLSLITSKNSNGPNSDIVIQPGMLTFQQRKALDYIYTKAGGEPFAVNALTVPLIVKTTWDYLFIWYGQSQYHYLPVWGGEAASGFPGYLKVVNARTKLPSKRFTIIEPTVGIEQKHISDFFREEDYFSKVVEEKSFGTIRIQFREPI